VLPNSLRTPASYAELPAKAAEFRLSVTPLTNHEPASLIRIVLLLWDSGVSGTASVFSWWLHGGGSPSLGH
jgi:hypothetical protein